MCFFSSFVNYLSLSMKMGRRLEQTHIDKILFKIFVLYLLNLKVLYVTFKSLELIKFRTYKMRNHT